ncbi:ATP-binding protein [Halomonas garicola]|uniref:ATP-binding protein n=1 Tax=Halomonas garicola TaxID=1690008 RepID=UPI0028974CD2|nr:SbcC/MukB-like Walker B domain-containing protein [Halomonas garicola]
MQEQLLDMVESDTRAGFRLQYLEVLNWGTFDCRVWRVEANGDNGLLTGDIGSGKSTLVDAMTTLLVPTQRVAYNKAAGAQHRERSLRSYVQGYYKSERSDSGHTAKPVALRDHNSYSVLLAVFGNEGYDQQVTLAQVFWHRDKHGQPDRFYLVAEDALTIREHLAHFNNDLATLRKQLRTRPGVQLFDSFPPYEATFRRLFGLKNNQALELFHQTVSMKSVGNLTDFVREHMLEAFDVQPRIDGLLHHFDDLSRAHAAVLKARRQIEALTPLVADGDRHAQSVSLRQRWENSRDALKSYFAWHRQQLLKKRLGHLETEHERQRRRLQQQADALTEQRGQRDQIKEAIAQQGGDRLEQLAADIHRQGQERQRRRQKADDYARLADGLDMTRQPDLDTFTRQLGTLNARKDELQDLAAELDNRRTELEVSRRAYGKEHEALENELSSLRQRRSNIHSHQVGIRDALCQALELDADNLPFAGELLRVREQESAWEGAAERVLHGFALSLLVADEHYASVARWVESTNLRGRLVYFRVRRPQATAPPERHARSLIDKLDIRPDSAFFPWLEQELARRFDYACCDDLEQFRREPRALTASGQIKSGHHRHEKDDRHRLDDRSRFVLGWSNEQKIAALENRQAEQEKALEALATQLTEIDTRRRELTAQRDAITALLQVQSFSEIDWHTPAQRIAELTREKQALESASSQLQMLTEQLTALETHIREEEDAERQLNRELGRTEDKQRNAQQALEEAQALLEREPGQAEALKELDALRPEALGEQQLTVESCTNREQEFREWLQRKIDNETGQLGRLEARILKAMSRFQHDWPLDTQEVDASLDAVPEYRAMLHALQADNLPRFEQRFQELLQENTINEIASFQGQLHKERQLIRERIDQINRSLADIEYNPGRYILLEAQPNTDVDIREFQESLKACTENTTLGVEDDQYDERKFLQVKAIIERFRGREGTTELDQRWTRKVTDVRQWFTFAASERYREDGSEYEHYTDSGGKSGGQKEKLAYTVLAASLVYQFGLEWGEVRSRSFRFVMIDEAFGRGSDESARFGLELFRQLNLQLLIVTPLQKIHIIEPYVSHVSFVANPEGRESLLRNLTIEAFREERAAREEGRPHS